VQLPEFRFSFFELQVMMDAVHVLAHYPRLGGADVIVHHCKDDHFS
jgi:hypothetical protein